MNEYLPYEDELKKQLDDLPLPSEDIAWDDMKQRLDKDDKDRPLIPPFLKAVQVMGYWFYCLPLFHY